MNKREKEVYEGLIDREDQVLRDLKKQYERALRDIDAKIRMLQSDELTQSRIYQINYQKALKGQVEAIIDKLHGDEYSTIQQYLHDSYTDAYLGTMYAMSGSGVHIIQPIDRNAAVKAVITDSELSVPLYASLGYDMDKMKKHIREEITRGIATSLPYEQIANNISGYLSLPLANAKRIVRTEGHRIQQESADDARNVAKAKGADVVKQWDASLDSVTRPLHRELDGQIRETDEPFEAGGKKVMYPGKFGDPSQDCNCRCVALTRARWALDESELETLKNRAKYFGLDKTKDFEDYKKKYMKAETAEKPKPVETQNKRKEEAQSPAPALEALNIEEKKLRSVISKTEDELSSYKKQLEENMKKADNSTDFMEMIQLSEEEDEIKGKIAAAKETLWTAKEELEHVKIEKPWVMHSEPYEQARSPHDVADALKEKGYFATDKINLQGLSLDGAKTIATALDRCFSEYPQMAGKIKGITISKRNKVGASYNINTDMFEIGADFFSDSIESMKERYAKMVKSGYAPKKCDYRGVIVHEFGHAIEKQMSSSKYNASGMFYGDYLTSEAGFKTVMSRGISEYVNEHVSRYAASTPVECFAECFNEYVCSPNPREMATWYGKKIDEWFMKEH